MARDCDTRIRDTLGTNASNFMLGGGGQIHLTSEEMRVMRQVFDSRVGTLKSTMIDGLGRESKLQAVKQLERDGCIRVRWGLSNGQWPPHIDDLQASTPVAFVWAVYAEADYRMT